MYQSPDIIIITCFAAYEPRVDLIKKYYNNNEKNVLIISTDYLHREKRYRKDCELKKDYLYIPTVPYKQNLSLKRLLSHYIFAKRAFKYIKTLNPKEIYVLIPCNSLAKFAARYKNEYKCKLILDIIDLWPESLPFGDIKKYWPLCLWRGLRDNNLKYADSIITECDLYQKSLIEKCHNVAIKTVYWPQTDYRNIHSHVLTQDEVQFLYLGSINHIIDIDTIIKMLTAINKVKRISIHIIGDGEQRLTFLEQLSKYSLKFYYYGTIYDDYKICEIASLCSWSINIMKQSVNVGLTMKSVSYMALGLPIINNLRGDTWEFVENFNIGINLDNNFYEIIECPINKIREMGINSRKIYMLKFSSDAFFSQLENALENHMR